MKPYLCEVFTEGMQPGGFPLHNPVDQCSKCEMAMMSVAINAPDLMPCCFGRKRPAMDYVEHCRIVRRSAEAV